MGGGGRTRRLFVALEVPPEVAAAVGSAFAPWWGRIPGARWVSPERLHVTIRFLGPVGDDIVEEVSAAVEAAASTVGPVVARLEGVGAFPSPARARVLWAGIDDRAGRIASLALALDPALAPRFGHEARAFRPHLTVARCDPPARVPAAYASTPLDPVAYEVGRVALFESVPGGGGPPRYDLLTTHPLVG